MGVAVTLTVIMCLGFGMALTMGVRLHLCHNLVYGDKLIGALLLNQVAQHAQMLPFKIDGFALLKTSMIKAHSIFCEHVHIRRTTRTGACHGLLVISLPVDAMMLQFPRGASSKWKLLLCEVFRRVLHFLQTLAGITFDLLEFIEIGRVGRAWRWQTGGCDGGRVDIRGEGT